jgi:PUA domain protein
LTELQLKNRHHLRKKESKKIISELEALLGSVPEPFRKGNLELAEADEYQLIIADNIIYGFITGERAFLTLRGFLALGDSINELKGYITVDKGAIKFVSNGADVMAPGIVEVEEGIKKGDLVWIREETHLKPLAVGEALLDAADIKAAGGGKAVKSLHYVGDKLWNLEI